MFVDRLQICKCIKSIYLSIPAMLPPFTWVTMNHYINRKVVLFTILNDGPQWGLSHGPLDPQSPALPSEPLTDTFFAIVLSFIRSRFQIKLTMTNQG